MTEVAKPPATKLNDAEIEKARVRPLHATGQAVLYDIQRRVRAGYRWWATGEVGMDKVVGFAAKMASKHGVDALSMTRHRQKKNGEASAVLFLWALRNDPARYTRRFGWLLLGTEHLDGEVMYDGARRPVQVNLYANGNAVFHLMPTIETVKSKTTPTSAKKTKRGRKTPPAPAVSRKTRTVYSWKLSAKSEAVMRSGFAAAAGTPHDLEKLRRAYLALPLVAEYRTQLKNVLAATRLLRKNIHTPMVRAEMKSIRDGATLDPLRVGDIPFISGFPQMYASPPMTLGAYLDANTQTRRELARQAVQTVQADHAG